MLNILSKGNALIYKKAFSKETLTYLQRHYNLIETPEDEQDTLSTNVLQIGNDRIISLSSNKKTNKLLKLNGYEVIEVDISEII